VDVDFTYSTALAYYSPAVKAQVDKFARFCLLIGLELEPFQRLIVSELFSGRRRLLILLPRGNGKTTLKAAVALWHLLKHPEPEAYVAAATKDQARKLFDQAVKMINRTPEIRELITPQHSRLIVHRKEGDELIRTGVLHVLSSDDSGSQHGHDPTFVFIDELHAHKKDDTYVALDSALVKHPESQMAIISTAGYEKDSTLGRMRDNALALPNKEHYGRLTIVRDELSNFTMLEWALTEHDDLSNPKVLKEANPASFVTIEALSEQVHSLGLDPLDVARLHANVWTRARESWLPLGAWDNCIEEGAYIPDYADVFLGVDIGYKDDYSAIGILHKREDGKTVIKAQIYKPPGRGDQLQLSVIEEAIRDLSTKYRVLDVRYDPKFFERSAQMLSAEGFTLSEWWPSDSRASLMTNKLYEAIISNRIVHDGTDRELANHVQSAAVTQTPKGPKLHKGKTKEKMDALMAVAIGFTCVMYETPAQPVLTFI
jgi:phage terminase large subunit-like protein